jgi:CheY-like chemotaxis protein
VDYIESVKKQLVELKDTLELNKEAIRERCDLLQEASKSLLALSNDQSSNLQPLYELPGILQSALSNDSVGALILGADGKVLLFNGTSQKIFGNRLLLDEVQRFQFELYCNDGSTRCPLADLPWEKALRGEESRAVKLYLPGTDKHKGTWLSIDAVPLFGQSKEQIGGAVILLADITEPLQVDARVKSIITTLSQHMMTIECAQDELAKLSEKLGIEEINGTSNNEFAPTEAESRLGLAALLANSPAKAATLSAPETIADKPHSTAPVKKISEVKPELVPRSQSKSSSKPILIVDDLAVNQKLLQLDLEALAFDVELASNGQEAADKVAQNNYLAVFMDCDMPVMNGYEATAIIRETEKLTSKHTPIIAMTAYDRNGDKERCYAIGMDYYLTKGVSSVEIEAVIALCQAGELNGSKQFGMLATKAPTVKPLLSVSSTQEFDPAEIDIQALVKTYGQVQTDEIVSMFFSTGTSILDLLQAAISEHNSAAINHLAYSLKGSCALMGLPQLAAAAIHIASSSALGKWEVAAEDYQQLVQYYTKLREQLGLVPAEDTEYSSIFPELPPLTAESDVHQSQVLKKLEAIRSKMGKPGAIKLVEAYDHDLNGVEARVIEALRKKDLEAIKSICHFLTGCYKSLNAKEAAQHCKEMNEYASQNDWKKATEQYVPMFQAIRSVSQALAIFKADNET